MDGLSNKTRVITVAANTAFTGSIQKLYSTGSIVLSRCEFGYFQRVGQTGSKAVVTSTLGATTLASGTTLDGPIVQFKTAAGSPDVITYTNNVKL